MYGNEAFRYSYSAKPNEQVHAIREKYLPQKESQLAELKRLDHCVNSAGMAQALAFGVVGCLAFGLGICLATQVIGHSIALGAFLGVWGLIAMIAAYPVYRSCFQKAKATHQQRILELAAELCSEPPNP